MNFDRFSQGGMGYRGGMGGMGGLDRHLTPMIKNLLIFHLAIFLFQTLWMLFRLPPLERFLGLTPAFTFGTWNISTSLGEIGVSKWYVWQPLSYMFLHGGPWHFLMNMLSLYWFGRDLESQWGKRRFLRFYLVTGIGAGLMTTLISFILPNFDFLGIGIAHTTIGASGAICAILMAYAMLFANRQIYIYFLFPVTAKHLCFIFIGLDLLFAIWDPQNSVSVITHLGGFLFGYLYMFYGSSWHKIWWRIKKVWPRTHKVQKHHRFTIIDSKDDPDDPRRGPTVLH